MTVADAKQLKILRKGTSAWNEWREENQGVEIDLSGADLLGAILHSPCFIDDDLTNVKLNGLKVSGTYRSGANLSHANLSRANLSHVNLSRASLDGADLDGPHGNTSPPTSSKLP